MSVFGIAASGLGGTADAVIAATQAIIIESVARQTGLDLETVRTAFADVWDQHQDDEPSLDSIIEMIEETVEVLIA